MLPGHGASKVHIVSGTLIGHLRSRRAFGTQVVAKQPVIMLATAHLLPGDLHRDLLTFISGRGPPRSAQQAIHATSQLPTHQALRNVVVLEQALPVPEPSPAQPRPDPNSGSSAQARLSYWLKLYPFLTSHTKCTEWDCISSNPLLASLSRFGAACCEKTGHVTDPFSADVAPASSQQQQRGPGHRVLSTTGQPSQRAASMQQQHAEKALSAPNAAELDRQRALQQKVPSPSTCNS